MVLRVYFESLPRHTKRTPCAFGDVPDKSERAFIAKHYLHLLPRYRLQNSSSFFFMAFVNKGFLAKGPLGNFRSFLSDVEECFSKACSLFFKFRCNLSKVRYRFLPQDPVCHLRSVCRGTRAKFSRGDCTR